MNEYIYETCKVCGRELESIEDIFVDIDSDDYVCEECAGEYGLTVVNCITSDEDGYGVIYTKKDCTSCEDFSDFRFSKMRFNNIDEILENKRNVNKRR